MIERETKAGDGNEPNERRRARAIRTRRRVARTFFIGFCGPTRDNDVYAERRTVGLGSLLVHRRRRPGVYDRKRTCNDKTHDEPTHNADAVRE